ncbi:MAG: hypothetical protein IPJ65_21205 [Archangiaceae bacterium]|nr:hypothetical protein [Archangiaceae bacterium]
MLTLSRVGIALSLAALAGVTDAVVQASLWLWYLSVDHARRAARRAMLRTFLVISLAGIAGALPDAGEPLVMGSLDKGALRARMRDAH